MARAIKVNHMRRGAFGLRRFVRRADTKRLPHTHSTRLQLVDEKSDADIREKRLKVLLLNQEWRSTQDKTQ
jgi:hypothetical protein